MSTPATLPGLGAPVIRPTELILPPDRRTDPSRLDLSDYDEFLDRLCRGRTYQADAIRAACAFLLGGRYRHIDDLVDETWQDPTRAELHAHYGTREQHLEYCTFPGKLAASIDLATATGKSYLMYGVARIALNEGTDVRRVLLIAPTTTIERELRSKFNELLSDRTLNSALPERPAAVLAPTLIDGTETALDGTICIENREQVYDSTSSAIRDSYDSSGADTLVLNDEAHHVYDDMNKTGTKRTASEWHRFLADQRYGFHRILGVSGTCFVQHRQAPFDYFADVLYRFSVRSAIEQRYAKRVSYIDSSSGAALKADSPLYQKAIWQIHQRNVATYGSHLKPVTIVVCATISSAKKAAARFKETIAKGDDPSIGDKVLVVTSDEDHKPDRQRLEHIDSREEPAEFVFSVSMLTEGWDARNVFQVVPYEERAFNSHLLIAQVLGRGLRVPPVEGLPTPVVRVFNHTKWAPQVKKLVDEILEEPETVSVTPHVTAHAPNFTLDTLTYTDTVEARPAPCAIAGDVDPPGTAELLANGVRLRSQRAVQRATVTHVDALDQSRRSETYEFGDLVPIDAVVNEQFRQLRSEAARDSRRSERLAEFGKQGIRKLISRSLQRSGLVGNAAAGLSERNIVIIRKTLIQCFPPAGAGEQGQLFGTRLESSSTVEVTQLSTEDRRVRTVTRDQLSRHDLGVVYSDASIAALDARERQRLSSAIANKVRALRAPDWAFKTPTTLCLTAQAPEWGFVQMLLEQSNAQALTSWVKSPDSGFYSIRYTPTQGRRAGQPSSFNPDFLIRAQHSGRPHIYIVETKDDDDEQQKNVDKVAGARTHVSHLNAELKAAGDRPTYSFHLLAPSDYLDFFTALRQGDAPNYTGPLHARLLAIHDQTAETTEADATYPDEESDEAFLDALGAGAWDDVVEQ